VGFVEDKVALGQGFSEYFGFPSQFSFHQLFHIRLSSGAGTIGQTVADVPSGVSLTQTQETKKKKKTEPQPSARKYNSVRNEVLMAVARALKIT
jgi:hypothetical protein